MSATEDKSAAAPPSGYPVAHDYDPYEHLDLTFFEKARRETPVFWEDSLQAYVLARYRDCERVMADRGEYMSASVALAPNIVPIPEAQRILQESGFVPAPSVVDEDGDEHKKHRRAAQPPFSPNAVRALEPFIRKLVDDKLDAVVGTGEADIVDEVVYDIPGSVILHMMGVPDEQLEMVKGFRGPWAVFQWGYPDEQVQIETAHGMGRFGEWARGLAQRALDDPGDDMISVAVKSLREKGVMDDPEERKWLDSYTLNIVMAGHETTVNTMAGGLVTLLSERDQWQALVEDPDLIPNAADEVLRHDTGVPTWRQKIVKDLELSGVTIPAGSKVYCALNSANRDEDIFDDGERFDVRRPNANKHLTFGKGAHTCMGNHLAKLEITIMLQELTRRLPHMEIVPDQEYGFSRNTSQRGPEHIEVRWNPAQNPLEADRP